MDSGNNNNQPYLNMAFVWPATEPWTAIGKRPLITQPIREQKGMRCGLSDFRSYLQKTRAEKLSKNAKNEPKWL